MSDNMSPIEQLLSEDNTDNIVLYDENGTPTEFVQVAIIPVEDKTYAIGDKAKYLLNSFIIIPHFKSQLSIV